MSLCPTLGRDLKLNIS